MSGMSVRGYGQDVLLGKYDFTTGADQLKASSVSDGITMGDIVIDPAKLTVNYFGDAVEISNWASAMNISTGKCINIPLTKTANASEFNVSRVDITFKRTTANKIQINFGNEINTFDSRAYTAATLHGTSDYATYSLTEGIGTNAVLIPAKTDVNTLYLSIGTMSASTSEVVYVDKIEIYGTVSIITTPSVSANLSQKIINASFNHNVTFPIVISGANLTEATTISLTGTDASKFSLDINSLAAIDLNAAPQTVNVTYAATELTYNASTRVQTPQTAILRIENPDALTVDVALTATCDLLYEDFSGYDATATSTNDVSTLRSVPDNVPLSMVPGWTGDFLYEYKAASPNLGTVCLGSSSTDSAFLTTPELDLSQPFEVFFKSRSLVGATDGVFKVFMDGSQLVYDSINSSNSLRRYESAAFIGAASSKLAFTGRKVASNEIVIDSIVVNYSNKPTLNIPLNKVENLGTTLPGSQKNLDIAIKGYNLTGDLSVSLLSGANFSVLTGSTVDQATALAGTNISVRFNAPMSVGNYTDKLIVTTSDFRSREITLVAISDNTTDIQEARSGTIQGKAFDIVVSGFKGSSVTVYNLSGVKVWELTNIAEVENIKMANMGCYVLQLEKNGVKVSKKVLIY